MDLLVSIHSPSHGDTGSGPVRAVDALLISCVGGVHWWNQSLCNELVSVIDGQSTEHINLRGGGGGGGISRAHRCSTGSWPD